MKLSYSQSCVNTIDLGLIRLEVVQTQGPDLMAVIHFLTIDHVHVLIIDHVHVHVLRIKIQEDKQSQPVVHDHRKKLII